MFRIGTLTNGRASQRVTRAMRVAIGDGLSGEGFAPPCRFSRIPHNRPADGVHDGSREDREPEWDADSGDGYGATIWMRGALPRLKCSPELSRCLI